MITDRTSDAATEAAKLRIALMEEGEIKMAITLNEFICFVNIQHSTDGLPLKTNILRFIGVLEPTVPIFVVGGTGFESLVRLGTGL